MKKSFLIAALLSLPLGFTLQAGPFEENQRSNNKSIIKRSHIFSEQKNRLLEVMKQVRKDIKLSSEMHSQPSIIAGQTSILRMTTFPHFTSSKLVKAKQNILATKN